MFGKKLLTLVGLLFAGSGVIATTCVYDSDFTIEECTVGKLYLILYDKSGYVGDGRNDVTACTNGNPCKLIKGDAIVAGGSEETTSGYILEGNAILSCTSGACKHIGGANGYYVNALGNDKGDSLIKCTTEGNCIEEDVSTNKGYYLNAGTGQGSAINCATGAKCISENDKSECTALGDIVKDGSTGKIFVCTSDTDMFELVADAANSYSYLTVAEDAYNPITNDQIIGSDAVILIKTGNGAAVEAPMFGSSATKYMVYDIDNTLSHKGFSVVVTSDGTKLAVVTNPIYGNDKCVDVAGKFYETRKAALCATPAVEIGYYYDCNEQGECTKTSGNKNVAACVPKTSGDPNCIDGYYIADSSGNGVKESGVLWHCENKICTNVNEIGYFTNAVTEKLEIKCVVGTGTQECTVVTVGYTTCSSVGEVVTTENGGKDYQLCLSTGETLEEDAVTLSSKDGRQYMFNIPTNGNLYGIKPNDASVTNDSETQFSIVVQVEGGSIDKVKVVKGANVRYRYADENSNLIYNANSVDKTDICDINLGNNKEYKLDQWTSELFDYFADFYVEGSN